MPRTKPTDKIGVYGAYDIPPEKAVESYVESKLQDKIFVQPPNWDVPRAGLEIESIQTEREYAKISEIQADMRAAIEQRAVDNEKRIQELDLVQQDLREKIISVNEFVRDYEGKMTDTARKFVREQKEQTELQTEIVRYEEKIKVLAEFHDTLEKTVEEYRPYEEILHGVVAESDQFNSIDDVMARCDALMLAQAEIAEMESDKIKSIEEIRMNLVLATKQAAENVMGLNNQLHDLQCSYLAAKAENLRWESALARTKEFIGHNEMTTDRMLDAIQQLYTKLCRRAGDPVLYSRDNPEKMLDYIKTETEILQEVVRLSQERMEREKQSGDVDWSSSDDEQKKDVRKPKKGANRN